MYTHYIPPFTGSKAVKLAGGWGTSSNEELDLNILLEIIAALYQKGGALQKTVLLSCTMAAKQQ